MFEFEKYVKMYRTFHNSKMCGPHFYTICLLMFQCKSSMSCHDKQKMSPNTKESLKQMIFLFF